jgi:DNA-binding NarL/FixJ family response regulator
VEALREGRSFFTAKVTRRLLDKYLETQRKMGAAGDVGARRLTSREREILQLLAEGHSSKQVGVALNISTKTAATHRVNIMQKIECRSVAGLVRYAIRNHIIEA